MKTLWEKIKRGFESHPEDFGLSAAEMLVGNQAAVIEAARIASEETCSADSKTSEAEKPSTLPDQH